MMYPMQEGGAAQFGRAYAQRAEPLGDADRGALLATFKTADRLFRVLVSPAFERRVGQIV
jgi:hypothetical protein